jgi:hypothetical protein
MKVLGITLVVALCAASAALGGRAAVKRFVHASASGDYAIAQASGTANHPHSIWVKVVASPSQNADLHWTMVCTKGFGAGSKSGSVRSARAPFKRKLRMPTKNPRDCTVAANAQLSNSGRVTVILLKE